MKTWTLRTRITLWSALVNAVALLVFGAVVATVLFFGLEHTLDERLADDAQVYLRDFGKHGGRVDPGNHDLLVRFKSSTRLLFYAVGPVGAAPLQVYPENHFALVKRWPVPPGFTTVRFDGQRIRVGSFVFGDVAVVVASSLHMIDETVRLSLGAYLLALPLVLLAVVADSAWVAHRSLQPITALTEAAARIQAHRLEARLPQPPIDDEIGRHIRVLNEMFECLQRGFEQATRFTADASHELRTPLTILRGEIEQALRAGGFTEPQELLLVSLLEQVDRLQKITGNLLLLARFDSGKVPLAAESVGLSELAAETAEDTEMLAADRALIVRSELEPDIRVTGDPVLLRRLLLNLADNAVRHNRPGGEVRLSLSRDDEERCARFRVTNTGAGIPRERQGELFQRFLRLAPDRDRASGGTGLGLSLCREIAVAHGGEIALTRGEPDATEFTVTLPLAT